MGWDRYDTPQAVGAMNELYGHELRLWMNLFLPSLKLHTKVQEGSRLRRRYGPTQTPLDRLLASPGVDPEWGTEMRAFRSLELARLIDHKLQRIYALANYCLSPKSPGTSVTL